MFGNDFDGPIRDRLPPGFGTALRIVKWAVDPGISGDVYADKPFLYGNALSSVNVLRIGGMDGKGMKGEGGERVVEEGGERGGEVVRESLGVPPAAEKRKAWFLNKSAVEGWVWEKGRVYWCDFFNPYLDFNGQFSMIFLSPPFFLIWSGEADANPTASIIPNLQNSPSSSPASLYQSWATWAVRIF